jgi:hypothetical protein
MLMQNFVLQRPRRGGPGLVLYPKVAGLLKQGTAQSQGTALAMHCLVRPE